MGKLSKIEKYVEIPIHIEEPKETIEHDVERDFGKTIHINNTLITRHANRFKIWDITKLSVISLISTTDIGWGGAGQMQLEENFLYISYQERSALDKILMFDISDLSNPVHIKTIETPEYSHFFIKSGIVYLISSIEQGVVTVDANDKKTKIIDLSGENQTMFFDTLTNISKSGNIICVVSRHQGIYIYSQSEDGTYEFRSKHQPANGYSPTSMQWLIPSQQLLLIGNDNVVQYDIRDLQKPKRYKAAKIKTKSVYGTLIEREQEFLVAGNTGAKDKFTMAVLAPSDKGVIVTHKPKIEYKLRTSFGGTIKTGEPIEGVILNDDLVLIIGKYTGFFLLKAE